MRQQGVNQFDKGLNLDTNPITVDNHTLTGSLNATMVTMNGNELVLQNDMGNAKVDQAQLPEGYVPVGMKEYGGIVYVASYNPLKGESQIGCFPSPQRNLPANDASANGINLSELVNFIGSDGFVRETSKQIILINDTLRAGDKFAIVSNNFSGIDAAIGNNLIKIKVSIVDDEGNSVDITDDLIQYSGNITYQNFNKILRNSSNISEYYNTYKGKISGKLSIQEELVLPSYIDIGVKSQAIESSNQVILTFTPKAYKLEDGQKKLWNSDGTDNTLNGFSFEINRSETVTQNNDGTFSVTLDSDISDLQYTVYPIYTYNGVQGKIDKLKKTGVIDVSSIGSGNVTFDGIFKYYNDIAKNQIMFDYSIQAYIDNSDFTVSQFFIQAYNIEDLFTSNGNFINGALKVEDTPILELTDKEIRVALSSSDFSDNNYMGSFSSITPYRDSNTNFNSGQYYIGRLCAITSTEVNNNIQNYFHHGEWFAIITSSITNKIYLEENRSMFPIQNVNNPENFELDWTSDITRQEINTNSPILQYETNPDGLASNLISQNPEETQGYTTPEEYLIKYQTNKKGTLKHKYVVNTTVNCTDSFPFNPEFNPRLEYDTLKYSRELTYSGTQSIANDRGLITTVEDQDIFQYIPSGGRENEGQSYELPDTYYTITNNIVTLNYNIPSQFFSKLKENPNTNEVGINKYKFNVQAPSDCIVPSIPRFWNTENEGMLRALINPINIVTRQWGSPTNDSNFVENHEIIATSTKQMKYQIEEGDYNDWWDTDPSMWGKPNTRIGLWKRRYIVKVYFGDNKIISVGDGETDNVSLPSWSSISSNLINSNGGQAPMFILWIGNGNTSRISTSETDNDGGSYEYTILLMRDEDGQYYPINKWKYGSWIYSWDSVLRAFNTIYIKQSNQNAYIDYWTVGNAPDEYVFTNMYDVNFKTKINIYSYNVSNDNRQTGINISLKQKINDNNSHYNTHNSSSNLYVEDATNNNTQKYYFPKFSIKLASKSLEYIDSVSSPDQSIMNNRLLDNSTPSVSTVAIIKDRHGNTVITSAYKFIGNNRIPVNIDPTHKYMLCGYLSNGIILGEGANTSKNAVLMDIDLSDDAGINNAGNTPLGQYGVYVAKALKSGKLDVARNLIENYNTIVLKPDACGDRITTNNCVYYLGRSRYSSGFEKNVSWRKNVATVAPNRIIDIQLFKDGLPIVANNFTTRP